MIKPYIRYESGYKYQLVEEYSILASIIPDKDIKTDFIELNIKGELVIKKGYAWDGPSGLTFDTLNFMRGSLVHDALYQLLRRKFIEPRWRKEADFELKRICLEDGMSRMRAWIVHKCVRLWGGPSAAPAARKKIYKAP